MKRTKFMKTNILFGILLLTLCLLPAVVVMMTKQSSSRLRNLNW